MQAEHTEAAKFRVAFMMRNGSFRRLPDATFESAERAQAYLDKYHSRVTHKVVPA